MDFKHFRLQPLLGLLHCYRLFWSDRHRSGQLAHAQAGKGRLSLRNPGPGKAGVGRLRRGQILVSREIPHFAIYGNSSDREAGRFCGAQTKLRADGRQNDTANDKPVYTSDFSCCLIAEVDPLFGQENAEFKLGRRSYLRAIQVSLPYTPEHSSIFHLFSSFLELNLLFASSRLPGHSPGLEEEPYPQRREPP